MSNPDPNQPPDPNEPEDPNQPQDPNRPRRPIPPQNPNQPADPNQPQDPNQPPDPNQAPDSSQPSGAAQQPDSTQQPGATQPPAATQQPDAAQQPDATQPPAATQQPDATQQPASTQPPPATQQPDATQQPASTQQPDAAQQPDATQQQDAVQPPEQPESSQEPSSTPQPGPTQPTEPPDATQQPATTEPPGVVQELEAAALDWIYPPTEVPTTSRVEDTKMPVRAEDETFAEPPLPEWGIAARSRGASSIEPPGPGYVMSSLFHDLHLQDYLHAPFVWAGRAYFCGLDFLEHGADFEHAISATGFGRFHFCLLAITGLIYANTAIGITIVSFVLPAATCDFRMTSADKGWLTAAPMLGMVLGSYFWGCLADTKGRKIVLVSTLLIDGFIGIVSSFVQILPIFMVCRFINGFSIAGAMGICFPYLGEFQQTKYREKILCWMEMFWTLGVILLPLIAWGIIPITGIRIENGSGTFSYDSWNWFVAACGVPSLLLGFWLFYFPESPKFMMECGDYDDALKVLQGIYKQNTGDDPDNYPIKSLKEKARTVSVGSVTSVKSVRSLSMRKPKELKRLFSEIWVQTKALCRPPYLKYTILTCIIQFGLTTSYYTLMIWFPELFNRYEEFEKRFPNTSASVCDVSGIVVVDEYEGDPFDCDKHIENSVYIHTLIVGLACIPTSLWLPLCVHRLGAKFFLIFSLGVAGVVTIGLYFVKNSTQNLVLSCIFEALTSLAISLVFCVLVDLFPTNLRVMAAALSLTAGRGGGLLGNLSFGYLIDINCVIPIVVFSALIFLAAILCFFLPKTGQEALD